MGVSVAYGQVAVYVCWGAVALVWVGGAAASHSGESSRQSERDTASRMAGALAVLTLLSPASWWRALTVHSAPVTAVGVAILVPATGFTLWARVRLGSMWSSAPSTKAAHELRTDGPYRVTRHPVYTGIMAMMLGTGLVQGAGKWLVLVVVVVAAVVAKTIAEERLLVGQFPSTYERYRHDVPRLVPRIRSRGR